MAKILLRIMLAGTAVFGTLNAARAQNGDPMAIASQVLARYDTAWDSNDAQKLAGLYTDDAILLPANGHVGSGHEAVIAYFGPLFQAGGWSGHKFEPLAATELAGGTIIATAHWSATHTANGSATQYHGDTGTVLRKVGSDWKVAFVSWNVLK